MAVFIEDTDHQMAYNGTAWVDISAGFTYSAGAGLSLTNNAFSVVADSAAGLTIDNTNGLQVVVDTTSVVFDGNGAISAKVKANDALNVGSDGLNVARDGVSIVLNDSNQLTVGDVDFGEWS